MVRRKPAKPFLKNIPVVVLHREKITVGLKADPTTWERQTPGWHPVDGECLDPLGCDLCQERIWPAGSGWPAEALRKS
jgi:hypothetical protein